MRGEKAARGRALQPGTVSSLVRMPLPPRPPGPHTAFCYETLVVHTAWGQIRQLGCHAQISRQSCHWRPGLPVPWEGRKNPIRERTNGSSAIGMAGSGGPGDTSHSPSVALPPRATSPALGGPWCCPAKLQPHTWALAPQPKAGTPFRGALGQKGDGDYKGLPSPSSEPPPLRARATAPSHPLRLSFPNWGAPRC